MFIAVLFTIAKMWKQPKFSSDMRYVYTHTHIHIDVQWNTTQLQKRMKFCHLQQHR